MAKNHPGATAHDQSEAWLDEPLCSIELDDTVTDRAATTIMGANPGGRGDMSPTFWGGGTVLFSVPPLYVQNNHTISYCMQYSPYYFS